MSTQHPQGRIWVIYQGSDGSYQQRGSAVNEHDIASCSYYANMISEWTYKQAADLLSGIGNAAKPTGSYKP